MIPDRVARIPLPSFTDDRGSLTAVEFSEIMPFPVNRIFYIYNVPSDAARGGHATYSPELIICVSGKCRVRFFDGRKETDAALSSPREGLYLPPLTWRSLFDFSDDCVLLCLSDRPYDKKDYINDFHDYLQIKRQNTDGEGAV